MWLVKLGKQIKDLSLMEVINMSAQKLVKIIIVVEHYCRVHFKIILDGNF